MVRNMTKGSPVKLLLAFALPLLVANVFQQLYSVADAMVLGRGVGVNALAAAGSTGSVHFFIFGFINGLTHGYSILISQRFGAGDESDMRRTVMNAGYLGFMSAVVITALSLIFSRPLMTLMGTPTDIFDDALLYIRIIFIGILTIGVLQYAFEYSSSARRQHVAAHYHSHQLGSEHRAGHSVCHGF